MLKSLLSNIISNRFKFIMIPTRGINMWRPSYKWTDDSYCRKNYGMSTTWCQVSLKGGQFTGYSKGATSRVNIIYDIL